MLLGEPVATDRLDVWRELIRENVVALDIVADDRVAFRGQVQSAELGHLHVATVDSGPQEFTRTSPLALADIEAHVQVGLLTCGRAVVQQDGREAVLTPGDFALCESDRTFRWRLEADWQLLVLTWPRTCIRIPISTSRTLTARRLSGSHGLGAVVGRMLRDLVSAPPELSAGGSSRLGDALLELVTTVAQERVAPTEREPSTSSFLQRVDDYIEEHVNDPDLGPAGIAAAHFISTRHLHRLFATRGTSVSQQILRLRLERARHDLRSPSSGATSITDISWRWGFSDLATFSRAFRAAYGTTPTRFRSGGAP